MSLPSLTLHHLSHRSTRYIQQLPKKQAGQVKIGGVVQKPWNIAGIGKEKALNDCLKPVMAEDALPNSTTTKHYCQTGLQRISWVTSVSIIGMPPETTRIWVRWYQSVLRIFENYCIVSFVKQLPLSKSRNYGYKQPRWNRARKTEMLKPSQNRSLS